MQITDTHLSLYSRNTLPLSGINEFSGSRKARKPNLFNSEEIFSKTYKYISIIHPDLLIHTGDITSRGTEDELKKAKEIFACYPYRQIVILSDHDYHPEKRNICSLYFPFRNQCITQNGWKIITLSVFPSDEDLQWFKKEVKSDSGTKKIIFTHRLIVCNRFIQFIAKRFMKVDLLSPRALELKRIIDNLIICSCYFLL